MNKEATLTRIPLSALRFGHEATPPINSRRTGRKDEVEALAASILAHGLILPLAVRLIDEQHFVIDGNRRLAAHQHLLSTAAIPADHPVDCIVREGTEAADEASLAANLMRVALHDADAFVSFHELSQRGLSESEIASRFGIDVKRVRKMLALGALSPVILDAWRDDQFGSQAIDCVRAFTLAPFLEDQERVFAQLASAGQFWPRSIKQAFGAEGDQNWMLETVGVAAYIAAGGHVTEDLFGTSHAISDPELIKKMFDDVIAAECARLISDGWAWAKPEGQMPSNWNWNWQKEKPEPVEPNDDELKRLGKLQKLIDKAGDQEDTPAELEAQQIREHARLRGYTDEMKARCGCVVSANRWKPMPHVSYGIVEPKPVVKAKTVDPATGEEIAEVVTISGALAERLSEQLTLAARDAMAAKPQVALAALVAALQVNHYDSEQPINVAVNSAIRTDDDDDDQGFVDAFSALLQLGTDDLIAAATSITATAISMRRTIAGPPRSENLALLNALDSDALSDALLKRFDAEDYFKSAPAAVIISAIEETMGAGRKMKTLQGKKKKELVEIAMQQVVPMGWLPTELRTAAYTGPGAVTEKEAA